MYNSIYLSSFRCTLSCLGKPLVEVVVEVAPLEAAGAIVLFCAVASIFVWQSSAPKMTIVDTSLRDYSPCQA